MIITLTGANDYALGQALKKLRQDFIKDYTDLGLEQYDGQEVDLKQIRSILQALPFLVDRRFIIFRQPSAQKAVQDELEQLLDEVSDATDLVIVEPKLDKRTSYYKALKKQTDFREFIPLDERGLTQWLAAEAEAGEGTLSLADALYLVHRVGSNQLLLSNEVQKLLNYKLAINRATIDEMTEPNPQSSVFDLLDAALSGQKQKTVTLYHEQRQQKVEPLAIMAMLAWQLHILALVKTAGDKNPAVIASQAKVNPYVVSKTQNVARNCTLAEVKIWVHNAAELDRRLKSQPIDSDEAMISYLLSLSTS
ncbi:MAG: DNA polymerase III subunit delta [Candidatus Saccharibacteria bacterium]